MKMLSLLLLTTLSTQAWSQRFQAALEESQKKIQSEVSKPSGSGGTSTGAPIEKKESGSCEVGEKQTSIPLKYLTSFIREKDGNLKVSHDPRSGKVKISTGPFIGNCASMISLSMTPREVDGKKQYVLEAKIKKEGLECKEDVCTYGFWKKENGQPKGEKKEFPATLEGFDQCLSESGLFSEKGELVESAIYNEPLSVEFQGIQSTGDLIFKSTGPSDMSAKFGEYVEKNKCEKFESMTAEGLKLLSYEDEQQLIKDKKKKEVEGCGDYAKIDEYIEQFQDYSEDMIKIRDQLILESAKKSFKAVVDGKYTAEDIKNIEAFEKYISNPAIAKAKLLYEEASKLQGEEKRAKMIELNKQLGLLAEFNSEPYASQKAFLKLDKIPDFESAKVINRVKAGLYVHSQLGKNDEKGILIDPTRASELVINLKTKYEDEVLVRSGAETGRSQQYASEASAIRERMQNRTKNFVREINIDYACIANPSDQQSQMTCLNSFGTTCERYCRDGGGKYCFNYWVVNKQACILEAQENIRVNTARLKHYNELDDARAKELEGESQSYAEMEREGRAYQNGESSPGDAPTTAESDGPVSRDPSNSQQGGNPGVYNFQWPGPGVQGAQNYSQSMTPSMGPIQNPALNYNPGYLGQPGTQYGAQFGAQFGGGMNNQMYGQQYGQFGQYPQYGGGPGVYNFQWNGGGQQMQPQYGAYPQQPQQGGYWGNPYQAYGNFNMYSGQQRLY